MIFRLAHYRRLKSMTQVQVAEAIGISQGLYNQLESGKRRMNETYLEALAELYSIAPALLIVDPIRDDPLFRELDEAYRQLSPSERKVLVSSAKGIVAAKG
jgi:transcriptional regulator with XRE-family HTH domain